MNADIKWLDNPEVFRVNQLAAHSDHNYYVRYENQIFILSEDSEIVLSKEQIAIIREKMNLR